MSTPPAGVCFCHTGDKTPLTTCIQNVQYADDLTLVAETGRELQHMLDVLDRACTRWGMKINGDKTKVLSIGEPTGNHPAITLNSHEIEEVDSFSYLGSEVQSTARVERDVGIRMEKATTVYRMWRWKVFRSRNLSKATKVRVFRAMVMSVLLYGAETWPVTQHDIRRTEDLPDEMPSGTS